MIKLLIIINLFIIIIFVIHSSKKRNNFNSIEINTKIIEEDFDYHNYERELITQKIIEYSGYDKIDNEPYFLNGIIRKLKPKKCLEIGVARGGSSITLFDIIE